MQPEFHNHPAYGLVTLTNGQGSSMPLFGSPIIHNHFIEIQVHTNSEPPQRRPTRTR